MDNQNIAPNSPDSNNNPQPAAPVGGMNVIQPTDPNMASSTVNVGSFEPSVAAAPVPMSAPTPTPQPDMSTPSIERQWAPTPSGPFTTPRASLFFCGVATFAAFMFFTFGVGVNIWLKLVVMVLLSAASLYFAIKAYNSDQGSVTLLSFIISTMLVAGTVLGGGTYVYYYIKFKQLQNSFNSSSSSYSSSYD